MPFFLCTQLTSIVKSEDSFKHVSEWYREAKDNVVDDVVFVLIGSKLDLDSERVVTYDQGI